MTQAVNKSTLVEQILAEAQLTGEEIDRDKPLGWYCPVCHGESRYPSWLWPSCKEHLEGTMTKFIPIFASLVTPEPSEIDEEDLDAVVRSIDEARNARICLLSDLGPSGIGQKAERAAVEKWGDPETYFQTINGATQVLDDSTMLNAIYMNEPEAVLFVAEE